MASIWSQSALLPEPLKALCAQLLPRLKLVPELHQWLGHIQTSADANYFFDHRQEAPIVLWECLAQGPPLLVLLDSIGANSGESGVGFFEDENDQTIADSTKPQHRQERYLNTFSRRLRVLEIQNVVPYGEGFRVDEFMTGSVTGCWKAFRTVDRVLRTLEATYPGLYEFHTPEWESCRSSELDEFLSEQRVYVAALRQMAGTIADVSALMSPCPIALECAAIFIQRISDYTIHIVRQLEDVLLLQEWEKEDWECVFAFASDKFMLGMSSYRAYCCGYAALLDCLNEPQGCEADCQAALTALLAELRRQFFFPLKHVLSYQAVLSKFLSLTHPQQQESGFNSLVRAHDKWRNIARDISDALRHQKTSWVLRKLRPFVEGGEDDFSLASFGPLLMDGEIQCSLGPHDEAPCNVFLFTHALFVCLPLNNLDQLHEGPYPRTARLWDLPFQIDPSASIHTPLLIRMSSIKWIHQPEVEGFILHIKWVEGTALNITRLRFEASQELHDWVSALQRVIPSEAISLLQDSGHESAITLVDNGHTVGQQDLFRYLETWNRRKSKPCSWSLRARLKSGTTPKSSIHAFSLDNLSDSLPFSPGALPQLFGEPKFTDNAEVRSIRSVVLSEPMSPRGAISLQAVLSRLEQSCIVQEANGLYSPPPTPDIAESTDFVKLERPPAGDLTGLIVRTERFPAAQGGYADVWRAELKTPRGMQKVAVKVLRAKLSDSTRDERVQKRLRREIKVWQKLDHPNIIPLLGTTNDFGAYTSMVCPWYANGSVRTYLMKRGNRISLSLRLRLLRDVATGLSHLHSCGIAHGDLTGSNVLIDDEERARLCDFGLSSVMEELTGSSYYTSNLGGAVRWAAPEVYQFDFEQSQLGTSITPASDIYSYGSVALEILSGEVPYQYLRSDGQVLLELSKGIRPRRPSSVFITDFLWDFISDCWQIDPEARPSIADISQRMRVFHQRSLIRHSI